MSRKSASFNFEPWQWAALAASLGGFGFVLWQVLAPPDEQDASSALDLFLNEPKKVSDYVTTVISGRGVNPNGHDLSKLHPSLQALLAWADENVKITITSTGRSIQEQASLYAIGRTDDQLVSANQQLLAYGLKPVSSRRNPWTNMDSSPRSTLHDDGTLGPIVAPSIDPAQHGFRGDGYIHAFDFNYNGTSETDRQALIAQGKSMGLVWGGDFVHPHPDPVHFETTVWRSVGSPSANYA